MPRFSWSYKDGKSRIPRSVVITVYDKIVRSRRDRNLDKNSTVYWLCPIIPSLGYVSPSADISSDTCALLDTTYDIRIDIMQENMDFGGGRTMISRHGSALGHTHGHTCTHLWPYAHAHTASGYQGTHTHTQSARVKLTNFIVIYRTHIYIGFISQEK
jgi:hypothetical protein